eukprot:783809-Prymnesium_polylepis.1
MPTIVRIGHGSDHSELDTASARRSGMPATGIACTIQRARSPVGVARWRRGIGGLGSPAGVPSAGRLPTAVHFCAAPCLLAVRSGGRRATYSALSWRSLSLPVACSLVPGPSWLAAAHGCAVRPSCGSIRGRLQVEGDGKKHEEDERIHTAGDAVCEAARDDLRFARVARDDLRFARVGLVVLRAGVVLPMDERRGKLVRGGCVQVYATRGELVERGACAERRAHAEVLGPDTLGENPIEVALDGAHSRWVAALAKPKEAREEVERRNDGRVLVVIIPRGAHRRATRPQWKRYAGDGRQLAEVGRTRGRGVARDGGRLLDGKRLVCPEDP